MMHPGHDHVFIAEDGRAAVVPIERVRAETSNEICLPQDFAIQIQGGESAAFEIDKDRMSIGGRGRVATGTVPMTPGVLWSKRGQPERLAGPTKSQRRIKAV